MTSDRKAVPTITARRKLLLALAAAAAAALAVLVVLQPWTDDDQTSLDSRQELVASRGSQVMPFDLEQTTHIFTKTDTGGVQSVTADDPSNSEQVELVRSHLQSEADRFAGGDYTDPASIHGTDMPGLAALTDGYDQISVSYRQTADGAELTFSTTEKSLVTALHRWFDAQVSDHGEHATHGTTD